MAKSINLHSSFNELLLQASSDAYEKVGCISGADVYTVKHKTSEALFVATIVKLDKVNNEDLELIKKGIQVTRLLKHQNVLPFLTCFVDVSELWTICPYYEFGSTSELSKPSGIEDEICLAYILKDTLEALEYLHQRAIIHRAVRGSHILVSRSGRCVLSGLNYCTSMIRNGKLQTAIHEYPNNATANLNWLAPEVLEQNLLGYDSKSDVYSLGITCCELANGVVPFDNLHPTEMLLDKLTGHYPKPLDSTCAHFIRLPEGMTAEEQEKYKVYESRRFSDLFHTFTVELCLVGDPHKRPTAAQLLNHRFIKQLKKAAPAHIVFGQLASKRTSGSIGSLSSSFPDSRDEPGSDQDVSWTFPQTVG
ncbi:STE20-related kinase adapter protein alpha [Halotydeus destructor]|nr:STE20-related kinase adapter protein alpha [Halotydeus destructor]